MLFERNLASNVFRRSLNGERLVHYSINLSSVNYWVIWIGLLFFYMMCLKLSFLCYMYYLIISVAYEVYIHTIYGLYTNSYKPSLVCREIGAMPLSMLQFWKFCPSICLCIVLYLYVYIALLAVHTNQKRFQCERPREKRAVLSLVCLSVLCVCLFVCLSCVFVCPTKYLQIEHKRYETLAKHSISNLIYSPVQQFSL